MTGILMVGDTGTGDKHQYAVKDGMRHTIESNPDIVAVCIVGDNIYYEGVKSLTDPQFQEKFEKPYRDIDLPFHLCLGNHDYGNGHFSDGRYKFQIEYSNISNKWNMPSRYYMKSIGADDSACDLFFLDTNLEYMNENEKTHQLNDIRNLYRNSTNPWKILCGHHTWRSTGGHGDADDVFEKFLQDLYKTCRFDLYVCGHDHCKNLSVVTLPDKHQIHNVVIGTGGMRYDDGPVNRNTQSDTDLRFVSTELGFLMVHAEPHQLTLTFHDDGANIEHTATIFKPRAQKIYRNHIGGKMNTRKKRIRTHRAKKRNKRSYHKTRKKRSKRKPRRHSYKKLRQTRKRRTRAMRGGSDEDETTGMNKGPTKKGQ